MIDFRRDKVLEMILKEAPVLSNRRAEINTGFGKRFAYAYYFNRGEPDEELKYNRKEAPISTTPESSLCEIYSVFGARSEEVRQKLIREGEMNEDDFLYQGPWITDSR